MTGLDPRAKLVATGVVAVWIAALPPGGWPWALGLCGILAAAAPSPATLARHAFGAVPFVLVPIGFGALSGAFEPARAVDMATRGFSAALVAALLVAVTPASELLAGASALGAPDLLVQTLALALRYLDVLDDRARAMLASARARGFGPRSPRRLATAGTMVGALLVRSLDRAERVHRAMVARGYTGRFPAARPLRLRGRDAAFVGVVATVCAATWWQA